MPEGNEILVTGAAGFIGSHLTEELLRRGHCVRAFVRYTSTGSIGWLKEIPEPLVQNLKVFFGDIRDPRAVREAATGCRQIYHLAALIGIPYSYVAPQSYVEVNVTGTLNILEAARDLGIPETITTSTSEVYGTAVYVPIDEGHPLHAQSPYSASKIGADQIALSFYKAFGLPVTIVRPFNTFGPRQSARAVIPTIVTQALVSDCIELGNLSPVRDLIFVRDTVEGFIKVAQSPHCVGRVVNLATSIGISVGELVEMISDLMNRKLQVLRVDARERPESSEVFRLIGAATVARELAGWEAKTPLGEGLRKTIEWIREHLELYRVGAYCV